jgi:hypothetical protein
MIAENNKRSLLNPIINILLLTKIPMNIKNVALVVKRREQFFDTVIKLFSERVTTVHSTTLREISKEPKITFLAGKK